jgi:hypothetical protein
MCLFNYSLNGASENAQQSDVVMLTITIIDIQLISLVQQEEIKNCEIREHDIFSYFNTNSPLSRT